MFLLRISLTSPAQKTWSDHQEVPNAGKGELYRKDGQAVCHGRRCRHPGFLTLNGDASWPNGASRKGVFEFEAPAAQTDTVFNVTKNSIDGWYNQYRHINGYGAQGRKQLRRAFHDCAEQGSNLFGKVDCILADRVSYDNYVDELEGFIAQDRTKISGDPGPTEEEFREGVPFFLGGSTRICSGYIKPNDFATTNAHRRLLRAQRRLGGCTRATRRPPPVGLLTATLTAPTVGKSSSTRLSFTSACAASTSVATSSLLAQPSSNLTTPLEIHMAYDSFCLTLQALPACEFSDRGRAPAPLGMSRHPQPLPASRTATSATRHPFCGR